MEFPACLYNCVLLNGICDAFSKSSSLNPINLQHSFGVSFLILKLFFNNTAALDVTLPHCVVWAGATFLISEQLYGLNCSGIYPSLSTNSSYFFSTNPFFSNYTNIIFCSYCLRYLFSNSTPPGLTFWIS